MVLSSGQLKEHVLNRFGFGMGTWQFDQYDLLGAPGYVSEQLADTLPAITQLGTTIETKIERDVVSPRQLECALVDFWFNHFNISTESVNPDLRDNLIRGRTCDHHQNVAILPHVLGDFGTMLYETAKSPAMLDYLDNRINYEEEVVNGVYYGGNDNYAREVMELHTVGVNGGYNEFDITEVARILTGWSVLNDAYYYRDARHDHGVKTVMGITWGPTADAASGEQEGADFLAWLADHPSTPPFLAEKMVKRFINETPPPLVVNVGAAAYGAGRDLGAMTTAIVTHGAFVDPANFRSKIKSPSRFVSSALQAMGAVTAADWSPIAGALVAGIMQAGEVPYVVEPPTGYPEDSTFWVSGAAMLDRFSIAGTIAYHDPLRTLLQARTGVDGNDLEATVDGIVAVMVPGGISPDSRTAVLDHVSVNAATAGSRISAAAHLIMCTPEFIRF